MQNVPLKPKDAIHLIVYDSTDRASPGWDPDEGVHKRGKHEGEHIVSGPLRSRSVTMFRLYPPLDTGKVILPAALTETTKQRASGRPPCRLLPRTVPPAQPGAVHRRVGGG
ncbi:MAG: hypothetical protein HY820_27490 [Acidobacteria bacterium]|nr:hypothetical protein [Acidobacteriota bacterium]